MRRRTTPSRQRAAARRRRQSRARGGMDGSRSRETLALARRGPNSDEFGYRSRLRSFLLFLLLFLTQQPGLGAEELDVAHELEFRGGIVDAHDETKRAGVGRPGQLEHERLHDFTERTDLDRRIEADLTQAG